MTQQQAQGTPLTGLVNSSFLPGTAVQFAWDSTSIGALKTCPRYYQLSIVLGYVPRRTAVDLAFGIWLHEGRERYYVERAKGAAHDEALRAALSQLFEATWDAELQRPWLSDNANKNRFTLIRTLCWYLDQWQDDPLETIMLDNGKPAVELSFSFETDYALRTGDPVVLAGHLDRLVRFGLNNYVSDLKSTKSTLDAGYQSQFSPDNQMSLYTLAGKAVYKLPVKGIILDAAQVAVSFSRFARFPVERTEAQLAEWYAGFGVLVEQAQDYAQAGFWPMNEKACFRCAFRAICAKPPAARDEWLRTDFERRVWDPLQRRGDI